MQQHSMTTGQKRGSRLPSPGQLVPGLQEVAGALYQATGNGSVPQTTLDLASLRAGQIVGNTYLTVRSSASLRQAGASEERITAVASWQDAPYFSEAERAALAPVEAVLQPPAHGERVSDELYAEAAKHHDPNALATLTTAIGQVCF